MKGQYKDKPVDRDIGKKPGSDISGFDRIFRPRKVKEHLRTIKEQKDLLEKIEKKIYKFYYEDSGFKNYAKMIVEDVDECIDTSSTIEDLYIIVYNSRLLMLEYLFNSLKKDIAEIDPDNKCEAYSENLIYKTAKTFVERISADRINSYENIEFDEYCCRLRAYADDLHKAVTLIREREDV